MIKYLILVLVLIAGALYSMYFWIGVPKIYREPGLQLPQPHLYGNPQKSISEIKITALYFVPKNKTGFVISDWREKLEENLKKLQRFHSLQLQDRSQVSYEIYPEPVIGFEENIFYDTDVTAHGNPEALRRITEELERRKIFLPEETGPYPVLAVMYEGVGASGGGNTALVSRVFLADPRYDYSGASILAHEFYHTLGVPDAYDLGTAAPLSGDIMGLERNSAIERAYLGKAVLRQFGY